MSETTEPEMMLRFMQGIKDAAGSAHQMAHARKDPRWLQVRDMLEAIRGTASQLAIRRALSHGDILATLDRRRMNRA